MKYQDFSLASDGFAGHMAEPDENTRQAVIIIMGGEKSVLPGIKIAERFADYGITGLSVSLFGAAGLPKGVDRIPVDMFEPAVRYLREKKHISSISIYGMSMGSVFAVLAAKYIQGIDNLILVSPSHVPFEGTSEDKKHMTGHSVATWRNVEIPCVKPDFSSGKMGRYCYEPEAARKVTGMWIAYRDAYRNKELERAADMHIEETNARILMIAGTGDEAWPSDYSVNYLKARLEQIGYQKDYRSILYPDASHLIGMMPNKQREKWLYRMIPIIGIMYRSLRKHKRECLLALEESEKEIVDWIKNSQQNIDCG